jgi:hypothetical protein
MHTLVVHAFFSQDTLDLAARASGRLFVNNDFVFLAHCGLQLELVHPILQLF